MVVFSSRITKNGNIKVSAQLREILSLVPNDKVTVSLDCDAPDGLRIPQEFLDEAGIPADSALEVYTQDGCVVIQEACDDR